MRLQCRRDSRSLYPRRGVGRRAGRVAFTERQPPDLIVEINVFHTDEGKPVWYRRLGVTELWAVSAGKSPDWLEVEFLDLQAPDGPVASRESKVIPGAQHRPSPGRIGKQRYERPSAVVNGHFQTFASCVHAKTRPDGNMVRRSNGRRSAPPPCRSVPASRRPGRSGRLRHAYAWSFTTRPARLLSPVRVRPPSSSRSSVARR